MAGPDGNIMYQCGYGGGGRGRSFHPNLADPPQMLRSENTGIFGTDFLFVFSSEN